MGDNVDVSMDLAGRPDGRDSALEVAITADLGADLPGLKVRVTGVRAALRLSLADAEGRFGFAAELDEPTVSGAGVELNIPGVEGGGYLAVVGDEYRGALTADLGPVSVNGFAILSSDDFSLLVLLAAEFAVPIQLSFGFTLLGVGGIIGINRRPDIEALREGLGSGALGALMFPRDAAAEADRLLPALSGFFPEETGSMVVGPMLKLGFGTPTLVAAAIGVLITTDGVVIVGKVAMTLPFDGAALIHLQAAVLGTITSDGLNIAASLMDSHIAGMPVQGDMALRIAGGPSGLFVMSAGGFHPAFAPPDGMAGMRRLGTEISPGPLLRARLEAYLAITTSSLQFGARAELTAGIDGFGIHGNFSFDALIMLQPFGFQADFAACVSVECADFDVASVTLRGHLSGTSPWRIRGHARVEVLGFGVSVDIPELTWGQRSTQALPPARNPVTVLRDELMRTENWSAANAAVPALVRLRPGSDRESAVHPLAELTFVQNAVPLDVELTRMDFVPLAAPTRLTIVAQVGRIAPCTAQFPPAQYLDMDDNARLASAGYAELTGGFTVDCSPVVGDADQITLDPETRIISANAWQALAVVTLPTSAAAAAFTSPPETLIALRDPAIGVVTHVEGLNAATDILAARLGQDTTAIAAMTRNPGIAESLVRTGGPADLQISRAWEVAVP